MTDANAPLFSLAADTLHSEDEGRHLHSALLMAEFAYRDQTHAGTGERLIDRARGVAQILLQYGMDIESVIAALLRDVLECSDVTLERIEESFESLTGVAQLVQGIAQLSDVPEKTSETNKKEKSVAERRHAENLRNLLLATVSDVRVMILRLAEQLYDMQHLNRYPPEDQEDLARETLDIYAPIASRLSMTKMQAELEDLAFRVLDPEAFEDIANKLSAHREARARQLEDIRCQLLETLHRAGIEVEESSITARRKHLYSVYRKMHTQKYYGKEVWRIYDRLGIRVIVPTVPECYQVLGVVHSLWKAVPDEFDDYISSPRPTGYQSLHTAVQYNPQDIRDIIEVQIRTPEMHHKAEYGVAAHWRYKEDYWNDIDLNDKVSWLRQFLEAPDDDWSDPQAFIEAAKADIFADRVYVFSPQGDIFDLPAGATPVDFAYHVHTEVGHRCRGAKVNGKLVSLDQALKMWDQVEIVTAKRGGPSRDWLTHTQTRRAQSKIRQWFRRQNREKMIAQGREAVDRELKRFNVTAMGYEAVKDFFGYKSLDDFFAAVGYGDISGDQIATRLLEAERQQQPDDALEPAVTRPRTPRPAEGINIMGTEGLLVHLAQCCSPVPGDSIVGYITRGRGVTVHRADCANIRDHPEPERFITVSWGEVSDQLYPVPVYIKALNRKGLLRDIGAVAADLQLNISNMNSTTNAQNETTFLFTIEVQDPGQLTRAFHKFMQLPNVLEVRRRTP